MEENNQTPMFEDDSDQAKTWIQENLRVIVSVFIVAAIALGIYSYSQRTQNMADEGSLLDTQGEEELASSSEDDDDEPREEGDERVGAPTTPRAPAVAPELSRETETAFVEQAERGNGTTHLARRALAHYLEKNPDSSLTAEHKIYIEDYLRKNVGHTGPVTTATSIEFSKDLIAESIGMSKQLNERQLENLKKYSARVSAYQ